MHALEILAHLVASLETEVGEVERADDVDGIGDDAANVIVEQLHARARGLGQARDAALSSPVEDCGVDVDADRVPLRAGTDPLAREARRAAEVLAQAQRL